MGAAAVKVKCSRIAVKKTARAKTKGKVVNLFDAKRQKTKIKKFQKAKELSIAQREQLVLKYRLKARKLGRSIMRKWQSRIDINELDSIVDLSLCEAAKRFNPKIGASFITFLYYHLRGNLIRAVSDAVAQSAVPVAELDTVLRAEAGEGSAAMRSLSAVEVAAALCNFDVQLPDEQLYKKEIAKISQEACGRLDDLERQVIERIYVYEEQLMSIASSLGYSRCHISRVKRKALEALHKDLSEALDKRLENAEPQFVEDEASLRRIKARKISVRRRPIGISGNVITGNFNSAA